jgi:hypothetical protein
MRDTDTRVGLVSRLLQVGLEVPPWRVGALLIVVGATRIGLQVLSRIAKLLCQWRHISRRREVRVVAQVAACTIVMIPLDNINHIRIVNTVNTLRVNPASDVSSKMSTGKPRLPVQMHSHPISCSFAKPASEGIHQLLYDLSQTQDTANTSKLQFQVEAYPK